MVKLKNQNCEKFGNCNISSKFLAGKIHKQTIFHLIIQTLKKSLQIGKFGKIIN